MWLVASVNIPEFFKDKNYQHVPVLQIEKLLFDEKEAIKRAASAEALIISSQEAAKIMKPVFEKIPQKKPVFCTGPKTKAQLKSFYDGCYLTAKSHDQEGLFTLIQQNQFRHLFYPKAFKVRPYLITALKESGYTLDMLDCYKSIKLKDNLDKLENFEGIYFGSSLCVEAFCESNPNLPFKKVLVPGHVTKKAVTHFFGRACEISIIPHYNPPS